MEENLNVEIFWARTSLTNCFEREVLSTKEPKLYGLHFYKKSLYPRITYILLTLTLLCTSILFTLLRVSVRQPLLTLDNPFLFSYLQQLARRSLY